MSRVFNFSAGPAALPVEVLEQLRDEMLEWRSEGMSVMEMSHRGKAFVGIAAQAEADLRELLAVPASYKVLFLQGGATLQFSMIPMCLLPAGRTADYLNTGVWAQKAIAEAKKVGTVHIAASRSISDHCAKRSSPGRSSSIGASLSAARTTGVAA